MEIVHNLKQEYYIFLLFLLVLKQVDHELSLIMLKRVPNIN